MMNIIIGGTSGLGHEITQQLQANGEQTFVVGRSYDVAKHGEGMSVDLTDAEGAHALEECIRAMNTDINFWWVAGYGYKGNFADQPDPHLMVAANLGNVLPAAQAAFRKMLGQAAVSHFVVVSSTSGFKSREDEVVYGATKFGQVGLARNLGLESKRLNSQVKVSLFEPGGMQTPFWDGHRPDNFDTFLDPAKVAHLVIEKVRAQADVFNEEVIERGSITQ